MRSPLSFWSHIPWIESEHWRFDRGTYLTCFRLILDRCHPNLRGTFGRTILHDVVAMGRREGVPDWVTEEEVSAFATTLLDAGARLDVRDDLLKSTPLGWACRWGRVRIVELMLERGADPVEADAEPWATPEAWARKAKHPGVLAALREQRPPFEDSDGSNSWTMRGPACYRYAPAHAQKCREVEPRDSHQHGCGLLGSVVNVPEMVALHAVSCSRSPGPVRSR